MSDLLADTLRLVVRRLEALEAREDRILSVLQDLVAHARSSTPARTGPTVKISRQSERAEGILTEAVARVTAFWDHHRQPMHLYKFAGVYGKRWLRQSTDPRTFRDALAADPRVSVVLTVAGGSLFLPRAAFDASSTTERLAWAQATKKSISDSGARNLDAALTFASDVNRVAPTPALTDAPDAFALDGDSDER